MTNSSDSDHGVRFNCKVETSTKVPKSVHELTPGDIKVIGAIGDSITAANGAHACNIFEVFNEYRGASWSIGGDNNLTLALTIPNILRRFNPDLIGFSLGVGNVTSGGSNFNCAVPGSEASDMPGQAENLVNRMRANPNVDITNDWKLITLFVGGNDLCEHCVHPSNFTVEDYIYGITQALDIFHEKLPRTFVNVVGLMNITQLVIQEKVICTIVHEILCECILNLDLGERLTLEQLNRDYQDALKDLASGGRYDTRSDFTIVYQPFMEETEFPIGDDGKVDTSYMAPDCFHLSAKGHAFAARELWSNMLQPVGRKTDAWDPYATEIPCPTKKYPYFATIKNKDGVVDGGIQSVEPCHQLVLALQLLLALLVFLNK
ncbi:phospholipase B1, membrane-associated-like [Patiria miniata]|uniref:Phospholipase B1, membrane-associated n=1 Tax=Patiria miniata TaxID=46514 RepID=A0A914BHH2_PATMI|nr:phospholipase B1, membrane-associated-like [Patiria miniata]